MITWRTWFLNLLKDMLNNFVRFLCFVLERIRTEKLNFIKNNYCT